MLANWEIKSCLGIRTSMNTTPGNGVPKFLCWPTGATFVECQSSSEMKRCSKSSAPRLPIFRHKRRDGPTLEYKLVEVLNLFSFHYDSFVSHISHNAGYYLKKHPVFDEKLRKNLAAKHKLNPRCAVRDWLEQKLKALTESDVLAKDDEAADWVNRMVMVTKTPGNYGFVYSQSPRNYKPRRENSALSVFNDV